MAAIRGESHDADLAGEYDEEAVGGAILHEDELVGAVSAETDYLGQGSFVWGAQWGEKGAGVEQGGGVGGFDVNGSHRSGWP